MKIRNIYKIAIICLLLGESCEDIYYPKEINSNAKIPVIQGIILQDQVPVVTITWALGYNDQTQVNISGAKVSISDNHGDSVNLEESQPGNYTDLSNSFLGIQGRTYTLHVKLPDGNVFISNPVFMRGKPSVDSLYAIPAKRTVYTYDKDNLPIPEDQQGLYIQSDLSSSTDSMLHYRFNTRVIKEMVYYDQVGTLAEHPVYVWQSSYLDNMYSVDFSVSHGSEQVLRDHHIGFLQYYYDASTESETSTGTYIQGWILIYKVYSVSVDVFNYYNSISQQLNSNDQIFAPLPSQVKSNIHCVNNSNTEIVGVFEASSNINIYKAFGWDNLNKYYFKNLPAFPEDVIGGSRARSTPDWWVLF